MMKKIKRVFFLALVGSVIFGCEKDESPIELN